MRSGDLAPDAFRATYLDSTNGTRMWVADCEGEVVGCVALKRDKHCDEGELARMSVSKTLRGGGVGQKLYAALEAHCHALGVLRVQLMTANPTAASFYRLKCGFGVISEKSMARDSVVFNLFHLIRYLGERIVRRVAIVGGCHGNERIGVELVRQFTSSPSLVQRASIDAVHCHIGNPAAVAANVRFLDVDLNRQFATEGEAARESTASDPNAIEAALAVKLRRELLAEQRVDFLIDLHSSNADVGLAVMVAGGEHDTISARLIERLQQPHAAGAAPLRVMHSAGAKAASWSLDSIARSGLAFEVGPLPHGTLSQPLLNATRSLVLRSLDEIDARNRLLLDAVSASSTASPYADADLVPLAFAPDLIRISGFRPELCVFVKVASITYPKRDDGDDSPVSPTLAVVAPELEGPNFRPIRHGDRAFVAADGSETSWPFVDPRSEDDRSEPLYTIFVNGAHCSVLSIHFKLCGCRVVLTHGFSYFLFFLQRPLIKRGALRSPCTKK